MCPVLIPGTHGSYLIWKKKCLYRHVKIWNLDMKRLYWIIQEGPKSSDEVPCRFRNREGTDIERWPQEIRIQLQCFLHKFLKPLLHDRVYPKERTIQVPVSKAQTVTLFGNRDFIDIINLEWCHISLVCRNPVTGILTKRKERGRSEQTQSERIPCAYKRGSWNNVSIRQGRPGDFQHQKLWSFLLVFEGFTAWPIPWLQTSSPPKYVRE